MSHKHPPPELNHCIYLKNRIRSVTRKISLRKEGPF